MKACEAALRRKHQRENENWREAITRNLEESRAVRFIDKKTIYAILCVLINDQPEDFDGIVDLREEAIKYVAADLRSFYSDHAFKRLTKETLTSVLKSPACTRDLAARFNAVAYWVSDDESRMRSMTHFKSILPHRVILDSCWDKLRVKIAKTTHANVYYPRQYRKIPTISRYTPESIANRVRHVFDNHPFRYLMQEHHDLV